MTKIEDVRAQAEKLGIATVGLTQRQLEKAIANAGETGGEPVKKGPIAKARKEIVKPPISDLYPWALNRGKAERAHKAVHVALEETNEQNTNPSKANFVSQEDLDQRVMDHYVAHGGLVTGQEKVTTIGRCKPFKQGVTTSQIVEDEAGGGDDDDEESDD